MLSIKRKRSKMTQKLKNAPKIDDNICNLCYCKACLGRIEFLEGKQKYQCTDCGRTQYPYNIGIDEKRKCIIDKIGVEMEGRWGFLPPDHDDTVRFHGDGSVHFNTSEYNNNYEEYCMCCAGHCTEDDHDEDDCCKGGCGKTKKRPQNIVGEYVSDPIQYQEDLGDLKGIILRNYPHNVNSSCGGHFHISFVSTGYYGLAMDERIYKNVIKSFKALAVDTTTKKAPAGLTKLAQGQITMRLKGRQYCKKEFASDEQISGQHTDRYTHFNYRAWHKHKTLEIRILPMFNKKEDYYRCVRFLCNQITNEILKIGLGEPEYVEAKRDLKGRISKLEKKRVDDSPLLEVD